MDIQGKLIRKFDTQQIKETFQKRELVVEYAENPQYPEFIKFELIQSNCEQLNNFNEGDELKISFNLKGRKWTDKNGQEVYFNSLQAWRLEPAGSAPASQPTSQPSTSNTNTDQASWSQESFSEDDDLPF